MNRSTDRSEFARALTDLGNIALVHHLPEPISIWRYQAAVMIQVLPSDLPGWRNALRGDPIDRQPYGTHERISTTGRLPTSPLTAEVYAYSDPD